MDPIYLYLIIIGVNLIYLFLVHPFSTLSPSLELLNLKKEFYD